MEDFSKWTHLGGNNFLGIQLPITQKPTADIEQFSVLMNMPTSIILT